MNGKRDVPIAIYKTLVKRQIYVRAETQPDFRKNMERIRDASRLTYVSIKCTRSPQTRLSRIPAISHGLSPAQIARPQRL